MLLLIQGSLREVDPRVDKVYYNPISVRPIASASPGQIVIFEDKGRAPYYSDGDIWIPLSGGVSGGIRRSESSEILTLADINKTIVSDSSSPTTYMISSEEYVKWEDDSLITLYQAGTGTPTFIPGDETVIFRTSSNNSPISRYAHKGIHRIGPNEWAFV